MLLLLLMQTDTAPDRSRMYIRIVFLLCFLLKRNYIYTLQTSLHLYPNQIRCIGFGSQKDSPSLTLLIECIIVGLIIVIKLNIPYALPHRVAAVLLLRKT